MNWFVGEKEGVDRVCVFFSCRKPDSDFCCALKSATPDCGAFDAFRNKLSAGFGGAGGDFDGVGVVLGGFGGFWITLGAEVGGVSNACGALKAL